MKFSPEDIQKINKWVPLFHDQGHTFDVGTAYFGSLTEEEHKQPYPAKKGPALQLVADFRRMGLIEMDRADNSWEAHFTERGQKIAKYGSWEAYQTALTQEAIGKEQEAQTVKERQVRQDQIAALDFDDRTWKKKHRLKLIITPIIGTALLGGLGVAIYNNWVKENNKTPTTVPVQTSPMQIVPSDTTTTEGTQQQFGDSLGQDSGQ